MRPSRASQEPAASHRAFDGVPHNTDYRALLSAGHYWEADTLARLGRPREALEGTAGVSRLARSSPLRTRRARLSFTLVRVGNVLDRLGDHERALHYYRRAARFSSKMWSRSENLWKRGGLIEVRAFTCAALAGLARHAAACAACDGAAKLIAQTTSTDQCSGPRFVGPELHGHGRRVRGLSADERSSPSNVRLHAGRAGIYQKSVAIWSDMAARDMLTEADDEEAAAVSKSLRDAEAAL